MDLLSEAAEEVRGPGRSSRGGPSAPERSSRQKSVSPPDERKKRHGNNRYGMASSAGGEQGPLQLYAKQIDSLVEMGFTNTIASAQALEAASGDVQRAIEFLTGGFCCCCSGR